MALPLYVIGLDLSGPTNTADTALVLFEEQRGSLLFRRQESPADDLLIYQLAAETAGVSRLVVGLDAPLSYQPGGGDREGDRALRRRLTAAGMPSGSVMTPTMTRMAYLTLRGMAVARSLGSLPVPAPEIAEVHPGGAMRLRGAPLDAVLAFKNSPGSRQELLQWLEAQGLEGAAALDPSSDHLIAACAAALAAWQWSSGTPAWIHPPDPPFHPYPILC